MNSIGAFVISTAVLAGGIFSAVGECADAVKAKNSTALSAVEKNKQMAKIWWEEVIVKENMAPLDTILAKNATMTMDPSYPSKVTGTNKLVGPEQIKKHAQNYTSVAETSGTVTDLIGEGNTVILVRDVTMKLPGGTAKDVPWVTVFHFKDGKISEIKHIHDTAFEKAQTTKK